MKSSNNKQSEQNLLRPNSSFRVDAHTISTRLVSSLDRCRILGCPTVYTVLDCSNKLVAGFSVCLGEPNLTGVMLALQNAISNKVPFCREFGIEITESEWPYHHIPDLISVSLDAATLSDVEMGYLSQTLGVEVFRAPTPYGSNWKDVIARYFPTINTQFKVTGILPSLHQESNHNDSRVDTTLSVNEFRKIVLHMVLHYNNQSHQSRFPITHSIEEETTRESPIEQWDWASKTVVSQPCITSGKNVELNLLPVAKALITDRGVLFNDLFYIPETVTQGRQITEVELGEPCKATIFYNPQKVDQIYLKPSDGEHIEKCYLAPISEAFQGLSWYEVHDYQNRDAK